jgi:hypothetical protein
MVIAYEPAVRFAAFLGVFAVVAGWEALAPRRTRRFTRRERWPHNLGLLARDVVLLRVVAPGAAVGVALAGETPDMHRVHHSIVAREMNSNFGFDLPCRDHLFGTYRAQPANGHSAMTIGLGAFRDRQEVRLDRLLRQPFHDLRDDPDQRTATINTGGTQ